MDSTLSLTSRDYPNLPRLFSRVQVCKSCGSKLVVIEDKIDVTEQLLNGATRER
jgi:hypothetical protein